MKADMIDKTKSFSASFVAEQYRRDFPALKRKIYGKPLVYLDNAATSQKPQEVIDTLVRYYSQENANIHRGIHFMSERSTKAFEETRSKVQKFLNARESHEIIFVRGATEAINLVAQSYGRTFLKEGDEILISQMEHHSNIVPWQMLCREKGMQLRVIPINDSGELLMDAYQGLLNEKTKLVSVVHLSNALGTINPVREIVRRAHEKKIPVLLDGAQAISHLGIDVQDLDCDFYVFSAHKLFGPTGVGVLYGKADMLERMPPYQGGGDMISSVTFEKTVYNKIPYKFEAGTPNIAGVIGLGAALDYVTRLGLGKIEAYERELLLYGTQKLLSIPGLKMIGTAREKASILSFIFGDIHAHDVGTILDQEGIAIRAGHHCAMPVMQRFGVPATVRASLAFYNTREDIDRLVLALKRVQEIFGV